MNTIIINKENLEEFVNYECTRYFEDFIFNEFRLIIKNDIGKLIYKIKINKNVYEVNYRCIVKSSFKECNFVIAESKEGFEYINTPKGKVVESLIECEDESLSDEEIVSNVYDRINGGIVVPMLKLKQYIMNKSYERTVVQREARVDDSGIVAGKKVTSNNVAKTTQFLLDDIIEYVSRSGHNHKYICECWGVRGHFRHYKDGKVTWISAYEKGKKRNVGNRIDNKIYAI